MEKITLNYILTILRMGIGAISLLIMTPYINRVLLPSTIGEVEYLQSIVAYFAMFTSLGIPVYGMREIAKYRFNIRDRSIFILEIGFFLLLSTILGYICLIILVNVFDIKFNKILFLIISVWIFLNNIGFEWVYRGLEEQSYITKRNVAVRIFAILLLFILVRNSNDVISYCIIIVILNSGGNIFNLIYLKKYISCKNIKLYDIHIEKHLKPILFAFISSVGATISSQIDIIMLGKINTELVAYYSLPVKLVQLLLTIIISFGAVLVPRACSLLAEGNRQEYIKNMNRGINYIFLLSVPLSMFIFILAKPIILVFGGAKFIDSVLTLKILCIYLFFAGINNFLGFQLLFLHGLEKYYSFATILSSIINIILNYFFIVNYKQNGAAIATVFTELFSGLLLLYFSRNLLKELMFFHSDNLKYFISSIICSLILYISTLLVKNFIILFVFVLLLGNMYILILIFLREELSRNGMRLIQKIVSNYLKHR